MLSLLRDLGGALSLLTIIPIPRFLWVDQTWQAGRAMVWFPLVGWLVGAVVHGAFRLTSLIFPPTITAVLTLTVWVVLTGGLHLDGVIDCCDALGATTTPERRLEIMKDPRAGAFGVIGAGLILLAKFAALVSTKNPILILVAPMLARFLMLYPMLRYPSARTGGLSSSYRQGGQRVWLAVLWLTPLLLPVLLVVFGLVYLIVPALVVAAFSAWAARRLGGGLTGDVYGATCELVETVCLIIATI